MAKKLRIGIVGGGIGGLALAVFIKHLNLEEHIEVDIYEAASELKQVGAGLALWPRGLEILRDMGLGATLAARLSSDQQRALQNSLHEYRKSDQKEGDRITELDTRGSQLFHRAELQEILLDNMTSIAIHLHPSHRLAGYEEKEDQVELFFKNGETASCDLLVGSDGVNSAVRAGLLSQGKDWTPEEVGRNAQPVWSGTTVYRELLDTNIIRRDYPDHRALRRLTIYLGKGKHLVTYPVSEGKFMNVVVFLTDPEKEGTYFDGLSISNTITHDLVFEFKDWEEDVRVIAAHMSKPSRWALQTVKPLDTYVSKRVVLIGDAAHAMEPHLASGAGQAIEDAYVLSHILAKALQRGLTDISELTKIYDAVRQPFGNFAIKASRDHGQLYDFLAPGFDDVKEGESLSKERLSELARRFNQNLEWVHQSARDQLQTALSMMA